MRLVIELGPGARDDFDDAVFWYEAQERGLGGKTNSRCKRGPR